MSEIRQKRVRVAVWFALAALALGLAWAAVDLRRDHLARERERARLRDKPVSEDDVRLADPNLTEEEWLDIQS